MFKMISMAKNTATYGLYKVDSWFKRVFKEQAGGAELIATLIIIGIVLILAFAFRTQLTNLVKDLWNGLMVNGDENTNKGDILTEWE